MDTKLKLLKKLAPFDTYNKISGLLPMNYTKNGRLLYQECVPKVLELFKNILT